LDRGGSKNDFAEQAKRNLEEENEDAEQGNQIERQIIELCDSILQFGSP
jgi:hypothetical protein